MAQSLDILVQEVAIKTDSDNVYNESIDDLSPTTPLTTAVGRKVDFRLTRDIRLDSAEGLLPTHCGRS
jgi:hypothetical protein